MRVNKGTGNSGGWRGGRNRDEEAISAMEREADEATEREPKERVVKMPYLRFLDPAHWKVET